jgi:hypothetical protein
MGSERVNNIYGITSQGVVYSCCKLKMEGRILTEPPVSIYQSTRRHIAEYVSLCTVVLRHSNFISFLIFNVWTGIFQSI